RDALHRLGMIILQEMQLEQMVQAITDAATELTGAEFGAFFYNVHDAPGDGYMLYTLSGAPREAFAGFEMPRSTPLFAPTFRGEGTVRCADVLQDPRYGQMGPHHGLPPGHLPVRSYL
ncbi:GAF domain-containing protein, partial [Vibrio parahaemolyticus]